MRSFHVALALGALCLASGATAQDAGAPALFPIPLPGAFPVAQTAADDSLWYGNEPSPSLRDDDDDDDKRKKSRRDRDDQRPPAPQSNELPSPSDQPAVDAVISPEYQGAMQGGWDSCTAGVGGCDKGCGPSCCPSHYIYANGLVMTHLKNGGFVTSIDSASGSPELLFCSPEYGNLWHGGFELGGGWCFGCNCNQGLEVVYWGLYPASGTVTAEGTLDSMIDFGDIDYGPGDGNAIFDGAATHRVIFDQDIHSLEVNLIGNYGGPLGCGRVGCCGTGCGERCGFGWMAGFRYINFTEDFLFSADTDDNVFDDEADQLNYEVDLQNNLMGFQMGVGLDYCITPAFQAYVMGKAGIYGNAIDMQQRIYGTAGPATLNNGPFVGNEYDFDAEDFDLAMSAQIDLGGRYAISQCWSLDFGWRVLGLSGVAITEDNVAQGNFQNVDGIADIQTTGSLLLHGGYAGLTYAW